MIQPSALGAAFATSAIALLAGAGWAQPLTSRPQERRERRPPAAKVERYAEALVRRYDQDGDGTVSVDEWARMQGQPAAIDRDSDGRLSLAELIEHIQRYSRQRSLRLLPAPRPAQAATAEEPPPAAVPAVAPWRRFFVPREQGTPEVQAWFDDNDVDGDGQVTMSEFAPQITEVEAARFAEIDANGDGVIVPTEYQAWLPPPEAEGAEEGEAAVPPKSAAP